MTAVLDDRTVTARKPHLCYLCFGTIGDSAAAGTTQSLNALEQAAKRFGFKIEQKWHDFACCDYYAKHGVMMPEDWKDRIGKVDAILMRITDFVITVPSIIIGSVIGFHFGTFFVVKRIMSRVRRMDGPGGKT